MHYPKLIRSIIVDRKLFLIKIKIISTTLPFFPNLYVEFSSDPNLSRKLPSNETPRSRIFILSLQNSSLPKLDVFAAIYSLLMRKNSPRKFHWRTIYTEENLASTEYTLQRSGDEGWFTTTRNFHPGIKLIFSKLLFNPFPHNRAEKRILMNAVPFTDPVQLWTSRLLGVLTIGFSSLSPFLSPRVGDGVRPGERVLFKKGTWILVSVRYYECCLAEMLQGWRSGPVWWFNASNFSFLRNEERSKIFRDNENWWVSFFRNFFNHLESKF